MKSALQKITITFVLISLIPVGFFIFEFSSLNDNEKIITRIYRNQLDAILYSVNQYTDDVFSSWANKIDISLLRSKPSLADSASRHKLMSEFSEMSAIREIYLTDPGKIDELLSFSDSGSHEAEFTHIIGKIDERITRLKTYQRGGFRKIEALDTLIEGSLIPVYFLLDEEVQPFRMAVLLIDLNTFVQNVLGPKIQAVSRDEFVISAFRRKDNTLIYSTETNHPGEVPVSLQQEAGKDVTEKELWLVPGYYLSISLKDVTINELVRNRVTNATIIFAALFVLLIGGILFLYSNIRREILLSQSKSEFVSNVSHEIRTPLSLISMYAETLELGRVTEERKKEYYSIIVKETARLSAIVNRILNFAQADASKKKYEFRQVDLNMLTSKVVSSYEPQLRELGFDFVFQPSKDKLLIQADEESITEAILNLLDNAIKYSREEKNIYVRTGTDRILAFVEVEDRGIGIAKVHHRNIFEQFYRVPTNNVHNIKGTGLGLALVKRTMDAHKGKVEVSSNPGKGSIFSLYFPLIDTLHYTRKEEEKKVDIAS
jgi:two-component system, OmpR family, phosphate regulon sensor histidine kinase PhoR